MPDRKSERGMLLSPSLYQCRMVFDKVNLEGGWGVELAANSTLNMLKDLLYFLCIDLF